MSYINGYNMPTPTIQAKLVLSTEQASGPTSQIGRATSDPESKKLNKTIGKLSSTLEFTLGKEGGKAFRIISWALPALVGLVAKGKAFGGVGGVGIPGAGGAGTGGAGTGGAGAGTGTIGGGAATAGAAEGGSVAGSVLTGASRFGLLAFLSFLLDMPGAGGGDWNTGLRPGVGDDDQKFIDYQQQELKQLEELMKQGLIPTTESLTQLSDGTVELRDATGEVVAIFGDGVQSVREFAYETILNSKALGLGLNDLQEAIIKSSGIFLETANKLASGANEALTKMQSSQRMSAGSIVRSSNRTIEDIRQKTYEAMGMDAAAQKADQEKYSNAAANAIIRRVS